MNSTHVVCQIVLGTMEKEKAGRELRMKGSLFLQMLPELAKALDISMPLGA